jgi:hypothetical protein
MSDDDSNETNASRDETGGVETFDQVDEHEATVDVPAAHSGQPCAEAVAVPPATPSITITSSHTDMADNYSHEGLDDLPEVMPVPPPRLTLQEAEAAEARAVLALFAESEDEEDTEKAAYLDIGAHDTLLDLVLEGIECKLDKADVLDRKGDVVALAGWFLSCSDGPAHCHACCRGV